MSNRFSISDIDYLVGLVEEDIRNMKSFHWNVGFNDWDSKWSKQSYEYAKGIIEELMSMK